MTCAHLLVVERVDNSLRARLLHKSHLSYDGRRGGYQAALCHLTSHVEHNALDVGSGRTRRKVGGNDDV